MTPPPSDETPAALPVTAVPPALPRVSRGRVGWLGHLLILTAWLLLAMASAHSWTGSVRTRVPLHDAATLLRSLLLNAPLFAAFCAAAWLCSRASAAEWRLRWRGGLGPLWGGLLYSIGLRVAAFVVVAVLVLIVHLFHPIDAQVIRELRPHVESAISPQALAKSPAFYWLIVTLFSAYAGLSEEVWRGGMLAGLAGVFPSVFGGRRGPWAAILPTALIFGLGHLYMGWPAVAGATLLGGMLGAIMVWHRTIWPAVVAHVCFDAASLAAVAWIAQHHPHSLGR